MCAILPPVFMLKSMVWEIKIPTAKCLSLTGPIESILTRNQVLPAVQVTMTVPHHWQLK